MTPSSELRRANHFVPAGYLSAFTDNQRDDGAVMVYDRARPGASESRGLRRVGVKRDLYVRDVNGALSDSVEVFLAEFIEGPFVGIRNRLVFGAAVGLVATVESLTPVERSQLARFVAFQMLRTPAEREANRWLARISTELFLNDTVAPGSEFRREIELVAGRRLTPAEVERLRTVLQGLPSIESSADNWLPRTIRNALKFAEKLAALDWALVTVPKDETWEFVTCDVPMVVAKQGESPGQFRLGAGVDEAGFEGTLALSPNHALFMSKQIDKSCLTSPTFLRSIRSRVIASAQRWVYARSPDATIDTELARAPKPQYHVRVGDKAFAVGHSAKDIERALAETGATSFRFRYGAVND